MRKGLIEASIKNSKFTIFFTIMVVALGFYTYYLLPKQESPDVSAPVALITTVYPGASPEAVEKLVSSVIENNIARIDGYDFSESFSKNSVSIIILQLKNDADVDKAWSELRRQMNSLQSRLPAECFNIEINTNLAETAGMIISLSGEGYSNEQLAFYGEKIRKELTQVDGISRIDINGELKKELRIEVALAELNQNELSMAEIVQLLQAQNLEIPSGAIKSAKSSINVRVPGLFTSLSDIENLIVGVSPIDYSTLKLKDIARIYWDVEDSSYIVSQNGQKAILLSGYFQNNRNIIFIGNEVREKLNSLKKQFPANLIVDEVLFQPTDVSQSISAFAKNLLVGMLLVIIVVLAGMGLKNALLASMAIPLSILMTFIVMYLSGIKVHEISIAALIIALGILVDNAIVIIDAIQVYIDNGVEKLQACLQGVRQSAIPIFTATLTTIAAFAPLIFIPGPAGEFLKSVPQVVIISLIASFIVAMVFSPSMAFLFFTRTKKRKAKGSLLRRFFSQLLTFSMKRKRTTLMSVLLLFAIAIYSLTFLGIQFFPKADKDMVYINIYAEVSSDLGKTDKVVRQVEEILDKESEIISYTSAIGNGLPKFYVTVPVSPQSQDFAQVMMQVNPQKNGRFLTNEELVIHLQKKLDKSVTGGTAKVKLLEKAFPVAPVQIRISGEDNSRLLEVAEQIKQELKKTPGTWRISDNSEDAVNEFVLDVDADRAAMMGISNYDIQREINIALKGAQATVFRRNGNEYNIVVKSDIHSKEELENLAIKSSITGNKVLLKNISSIIKNSHFPTIGKYKGKMSLTIGSDIKPGYTAVEIERSLKKKLASLDLQDVDLLYDGETKQITDNFANLGVAAIFALFIIYIILMLQFNSFMQPFVIFITIPFSLIGSIFGLLLFGQPISFTALLGIISLIGLVVKNAILLIEFINHARSMGVPVEEACISGVDRRFRPIILSAVTTIMGLVPLAFSGNNLFVPLSVALMSGLLVSTVLTLVIVPVLYSWLEGFLVLEK